MIKFFKLFLVAFSLMVAMIATGHENDDFKHGPTGECFGWELKGNGVRKCFKDREHEICTDLIFNHGKWHVSEEYDCDGPMKNS